MYKCMCILCVYVCNIKLLSTTYCDGRFSGCCALSSIQYIKIPVLMTKIDAMRRQYQKEKNRFRQVELLSDQLCVRRFTVLHNNK